MLPVGTGRRLILGRCLARGMWFDSTFLRTKTSLISGLFLIVKNFNFAVTIVAYLLNFVNSRASNFSLDIQRHSEKRPLGATKNPITMR